MWLSNSILAFHLFKNPLSGVECCRASRGQIPTANDCASEAGGSPHRIMRFVGAGSVCAATYSTLFPSTIELSSATCPPQPALPRLSEECYTLTCWAAYSSAQGALYLPRATPQIIAESLPLPIIGSHEYRRLLQSTTTLSIVPTHTPPPTPRLLEECYTPSWLPAGRNEPPRGTSLPRATPQTLGGAPHVMSNGYFLLFCCNLRLRHLHAP